MTEKANHLKEELATLPDDDRAELARFLLESLELSVDAIDPDIEAEWIETMDRRRQELHSGTVKPIPGEQVMRELREKYG